MFLFLILRKQTLCFTFFSSRSKKVKEKYSDHKSAINKRSNCLSRQIKWHSSLPIKQTFKCIDRGGRARNSSTNERIGIMREKIKLLGCSVSRSLFTQGKWEKRRKRDAAGTERNKGWERKKEQKYRWSKLKRGHPESIKVGGAERGTEGIYINATLVTRVYDHL